MLKINVLCFIVKPITCQPAFFVLLFVLLGIPDIYSIFVCHSLIPLFKASLYFFLSYILSLPTIFLPVFCRRFYKVVVLLFALFFFIVDIYLLLLYNDTLGTISKDVIAAVFATNPEESFEYISVYFTIDRLFLLATFTFVPLALFFYLRNQYYKWNNISKWMLLVFLFCSAIMTLKNINRVADSNFYYLLSAEESPDLRAYRQNPIVICNRENVDNVVLIIGESFSKHNSSLYDYEKETNPLLGKLESDSMLFVCDNVTSACLSTIPAIKSIMMSYTDSMEDSIEWYRCLTLIEIMQYAGYKTYWLSNQSKTGLYDNEVGRFADLCDEQFFVGDKHSGLMRENKDEELCPLVNDCLSDSVSSKFIIIQMMGSHSEFNKRYPASFEVFSGNEYNTTHPLLSAKYKQVLAEYDNSILYNDYVVYDILQSFTDKEAVVLYFSDHGIDVFQSANDYIGHGKSSNAVSVKSAMQIPFMVYMTSACKEKYPHLEERIRESLNVEYSTDSVMYSIMDVAGVETVNGVSYKHKSLFK